jgi:type IV pilus assembly protein PilF
MLLAVPALLSVACSSRRSGPHAATPDRQSDSEYDLARDAFLTRHEPRTALGHALKAVELNDENADAAHFVALLYLYFCAAGNADCRLEDAERYVRMALKHKDDFREARNTLGVVLVHQKKYDEAIAVLEQLTKDILYPTPETAWGNLGWAYLTKGDAAGAIDALQRAIALQPDFCVGNFRLGLAFEKKGDVRAARDALTRALETGRPECKGLQEAYEARARILVRLDDRPGARSDLERCTKLGANTPIGHRCSATLASLPQ